MKIIITMIIITYNLEENDNDRICGTHYDWYLFFCIQHGCQGEMPCKQIWLSKQTMLANQ